MRNELGVQTEVEDQNSVAQKETRQDGIRIDVIEQRNEHALLARSERAGRGGLLNIHHRCIACCSAFPPSIDRTTPVYF